MNSAAWKGGQGSLERDLDGPWKSDERRHTPSPIFLFAWLKRDLREKRDGQGYSERGI